MSKLSDRMKVNLLWSQLENEFSTFRSHYQDLSDYILPRRLRFETTDNNRGEKKNQKIIDATATMAIRTLSSGMMSSVTSPARPWFKLATPDPSMNESGPVKTWLHEVTKRMNTVFIKSNLYNVLPITYKDLGTFGTHALIVEEDFDSVVRFYPLALGSYRIAIDHRLKVNTLIREFRYNVQQTVEKFGMQEDGSIDWTNISDKVKEHYENGRYLHHVDIRHCIMPNPDYDPDSPRAENFRYRSYYYEVAYGNNGGTYYGHTDDKFLRKSGFRRFPVLAPRWEVTGEDAYGTDCPGMTALGDIRALQLMQKRKAQAVEYMLRPPMKGPTSLQKGRPTILPGDITYYDDTDASKGFTPTYQVNMDIGAVRNDIAEMQQAINRAFYVDLFLMLSQSDRREITAREIDERREEKLLALGPVLEQLNQDLLDPLIDLTFEIMERQGLIPEAPEELEGVELKIEYVSVMAQAQRLVGLGTNERMLGTVANVSAINPEALDKFNADQFLDEYSDILTIAPGIVRTDEEVAVIRQQRAQQQAMQQQMDMIQQGAGAARDLSQANVEEDNALTRLVDRASVGA